MGAILLSLAAAASWGVADYLGGIQARRIRGVLVAGGAQAAGLAVLGAAVIIAGLDADHAWIAVIGGAFGAAGIVSLYSGLAIGPMSVVAAISAMAAAVPILFGIATGETLTALEGAGVALAGAGVLMTAQDRPLTEELRAASRRAVTLALLAALFLGSSLVTLERTANESDALSAVFLTRVATVAVLAVAVAALRARPADLRDEPGRTVAIGIADSGGVLLFTLATTVGLLGISALLSSMYPVVTIGLAYALLHERVRPIQRVGVAAVLAGVAALSVSA